MSRWDKISERPMSQLYQLYNGGAVVCSPRRGTLNPATWGTRAFPAGRNCVGGRSLRIARQFSDRWWQ